MRHKENHGLLRHVGQCESGDTSWAESWIKARGHHSPERTQAFFDARGRSASIADWQFRQALDAARILACDVLAIP